MSADLSSSSLKDFLDAQVEKYNHPGFIPSDPISIPHQFSKKQDIEIMGFFAAILAWGQRKTILNKCEELIARMDGVPYDFIKNHKEEDLKQLLGFKHRTFNDTDLLYFVNFLQRHYQQYLSLEDAFLPVKQSGEFRDDFMEFTDREEVAYQSSACYLGELKIPKSDIEASLNYFKRYFFSLEDIPHRTMKHISSPAQKSTCKRLNMFLRWMVRKDEQGVDFGLWKRLQVSALICPCDVHVDRVARKMGLITRRQTDWQTALELTGNLRLFDAYDPVKYDFALFGMGVNGMGRQINDIFA